MSILSRLGRIIGALAATLVLTGCSTLKLGYNNLPELAYWWLDGYVHFSEAQAPRVKDEFARLHRWHRQEELPRLAALLARAEQLGPGDVSAGQACTMLADIRERLTAVSRQAEPAVAAIAGGLSAHSMRQMARRHERNNDEFRREWIDIAAQERLDKRYKQFEGRLERVYGRLEPGQREALRRSIEGATHDPARFLAERQRRQADLMETLRRLQEPALTPTDAQRLVRSYVDRIETSPDPSWRAHAQATTQEGCELFAAVHNAASPAQRQAAVNRLRGYRRDLSELAARP
jgi:hypothetical protein